MLGQGFTEKYLDKKLINIFFLSIISGLPFAVLYSTLVTWLTESKYPLEIITTIAASRMPYTFKFTWAPFIDTINIPFLHKIGRRKSWMVLSSFFMMLILVIWSKISANDNFAFIFYTSIIFGFMSATYDIAFDAYRIDNTEESKQGPAASYSVLGYRVGALISGVGTLKIAHFYDWSASFLCMATILTIGIIYILFLGEKKVEEKYFSFREKIIHTSIESFRDFFSKNLSVTIIIAILLYKVSDVLLLAISTPFYLKLGYTKNQIADVAKIFGFSFTLFGTFLGGVLIRKIGNLKALIICAIYQSAINLIYIWLHHAPVENSSLMIAVSLENLGCGLGSVALISYMSSLCNAKFSATQYALLTSAAAFMNSTLSIPSGKLAKTLGWDAFFVFTVIAGIPALVIFCYIALKTKNSSIIEESFHEDIDASNNHLTLNKKKKTTNSIFPRSN
jgi:MFS transporter, PAT family, beta-lactamase induction signal transducer AmpG